MKSRTFLHSSCCTMYLCIMEDSVVKVVCVHNEPDFSAPWQRKRQRSSSSTGILVAGRRLLVNARSVEYSTQVLVKKRGSARKYGAHVVVVGPECDIAMLAVNDDEFWQGVVPLEFGPLPKPHDVVRAAGYPNNGDTISVHSGLVSRIEVRSYFPGAPELLMFQIDGANHGGPIFNNEGTLVGLAFQPYGANAAGSAIPTPVINHFITDYERTGGFTGFPSLGVKWQKMENYYLRKAASMERTLDRGIRIRGIQATNPAAQCLQLSDILLSFDDIDIANNGTVPFHGDCLDFSCLVSQKYIGETARIELLRNGTLHEIDLQLGVHKYPIPAYLKGPPPSYYIVGGIVFTVLSVPYLRSKDGEDHSGSSVKLVDKLLNFMAQTQDEELVMLSQVLAADINVGYEEIADTQVLAFNGINVRNLKHLKNMVEACRMEYLRFDLEGEQIVLLESKEAKAATEDVLATYCIPSAYAF